jgi:hypothetical protein
MSAEKLPLIGRDRVWINKLTKSLRTDIGELGKISETRRGNTFEIRYGVDEHGGYIAKVTVELDRVISDKP